MNQIKCVETRGYSLTAGKLYDPIKRENGFVFIVNDKGNTVRFSEEMFTKVYGTRVGSDTPPPAAPVPPPPARTEQDCINSITNTNNQRISYRDMGNNIRHIDIETGSTTAHNSCGIQEINSVNSIIDNVHLSVNATNSDDDLMSLRKELFKKCILQRVRNSDPAGIVLLTTKVNKDEDLIPLMDEISHFRSDVVLNPNSQNNIKLWGFYKAQL